MSPSTSPLEISSEDPTAEIKVLDGSANVVARGIGSLKETLTDGLYKIRVRVGSETEERLVALDGALPPQKFDRLPVASPIPIDFTGRSHEYHQSAIWDAWRNPAPARGAGSRLLISAREWSPTGSKGHPDPAGSLSLTLSSGEKIEFSAIANVQLDGDAYAIGVVDVDPGFCRVELDLPDGRRLRRALHTSPGWTTQLYMLFADADGQRLANLAAGSVAIGREPVVHDQETRLAEIALDALTQHRAILSDHLRMMLSGKFEQPLLGLIGAHLLIREGPPGDTFQTVVGNLTKMLGPDHPDVIALTTKLDDVPRPVSEPPMLRASWDFLVEASAGMPDLFVPDSPAAKVGERVVPAGAWLVWEGLGTEADEVALEAKLNVVRAYVQAQARGRSPSSSDSVQLASESFTDGADALSDEACADLSRALGMPRMTLDTLLRSL